MSVHRLSAEQFVARPRDEVFAFFSRPENLARITPADMGFALISDDRVMRTGLRLVYRVRPLLSLPTTWVSRIAHYDPPHAFVDVQLRGPYRRWAHTHTFESASVDGVPGTRVIDEVLYEIPFGPVGDLVHRLVVRPRLAAIFAYRQHAIASLLPGLAQHSAHAA